MAHPHVWERLLEVVLEHAHETVGVSVTAVVVGAVAPEVLESDAEVGEYVVESAQGYVLSVAVCVGSEVGNAEGTCLAVGAGEEETGGDVVASSELEVCHARGFHFAGRA